jgi:hypothetical protein
MFSLETSTAHDLQYLFFTPSAPQTSQILDQRGNGFDLIANVFPLPSLRRRCVRRVGKVDSLLADLPAELHKACAIHSATGETARRQIGDVSMSFAQR